MSEKDEEKQKALDEIVASARAYDLTLDEITAALIKASITRGTGRMQMVQTMFVYVGAILAIAGTTGLISLYWDDLGSPARVLVTLGPGIIALVLSLSALKAEQYQKAATPLLLLAALLQPAGMAVFLHEYFDGGDPLTAGILISGVMTTQMALLFGLFRRTSMLFFTLFFAFSLAQITMQKLDIDAAIAAVTLGLSGLLIAYGIGQTVWRSFVPFAYFIFTVQFAIGLYDLLEGEFPLDISLIVAAGFLVYTSILAQSRAYLTASVLVMLGYLAYYTSEYFADMVSWPVALMVMGLLMIGVSHQAVKIGQRIGEQPDHG